MTMNKRILQCALVLAFALATGGTICAQDATQKPPVAVQISGSGVGPAAIGPGNMFAFEKIVGDFDRRVVTGAPFSAQVTRETVQTLGDGNRIDRKSTGTIARDSVGRTYRDMNLNEIGPLAAAGKAPHLVFIKDPAAEKLYILNEDKKTAQELPMRPPNSGMHRGDMIYSNSGAASTVRVFNEMRAETKTTSLGTKTMDGVTADGTRITRTIPAGQIGNAQPIVITTENWYSPDLQMVVSMTRTDPRFGTTTYQLTNISRADPPQSMFVVPQDFAVQQSRRFQIRSGAKPGMPPPPDNE
jgi:hypothetical protein